MKKIVISILFAILFAMFGASIAFADSSTEQIDSYNVDIVIDEDASIDVTETIVYNFGQNSKHGIYRSIPYKYKARGGNYKLEISEIDVVNENGSSYTFETSKSSGELSIKIGDANKYVTGIKNYIINYRVDKAFNYFDDFDELYWGAIGTEWAVPILDGDISVTLPDVLEIEQVKEACYFGYTGSNEECVGEFLINSEEKTKKATFKDFHLYESQGVTIVIGLPKNAVYEPTFWERAWDTVKSNSVLFLPVIVFIIMFYLWSRFGKDPKNLGAIIARYSPPKNLSPAESGMIYDEKSDNNEITATLIKIAINGYIKIVQIKKKSAFSKSDYELVKLKEFNSIRNPIEKELLESVFDGKKKVKISDLKNEFYKDMNSIKKNIYKSSVEGGYFIKNPNSVRNAYVGIGSTVIFSAFFLMFLGWLVAVSIVLSGTIVLVFGFIMPARTKQGAKVLNHLKGLKLYIEVAESERIKFHNAPKKTPKLFETLLPYAIIFNLEKEWAKEFEGIYKEPNWYSGQYNHGFSTYYMASSLSSFNSSASANMTSTPSSASSGGSGFSGGGVGGGFGGGGGGSW